MLDVQISETIGETQREDWFAQNQEDNPRSSILNRLEGNKGAAVKAREEEVAAVKVQDKGLDENLMVYREKRSNFRNILYQEVERFRRSLDVWISKEGWIKDDAQRGKESEERLWDKI